MAGVWKCNMIQLYSLDSSFAIGLRHSTDLSKKSTYNFDPGIFGLQNRPLGLQNRYFGRKIGFFGLQNRILEAIGLQVRIFMDFCQIFDGFW